MICIDIPLLMEAKNYAIMYCFQKVEIDLRLFDEVSRYELIDKNRKAFWSVNSINNKAYESATEETAHYVVQNMRTVRVFHSKNAYYDWLKDVIKEN